MVHKMQHLQIVAVSRHDEKRRLLLARLNIIHDQDPIQWPKAINGRYEQSAVDDWQLLRKARWQRHCSNKLDSAIVDNEGNFAEDALAASTIVVLGYLTVTVIMIAQQKRKGWSRTHSMTKSPSEKEWGLSRVNADEGDSDLSDGEG